MPNYLYSDAKDLLKKILLVNPKKRISLEEIKKHSWLVKNHFDEETTGIQIGMNPIPVLIK